MEIILPEIALVVVLGPSKSGKTTFTRKHFAPSEVFHLDEIHEHYAPERKGSDTEADDLDTFHFLLEKRLKQGLLTVIDGSFITQSSRKKMREIARRYSTQLIGIWMDLPESELVSRHTQGDSMAKARLEMARLQAHADKFQLEGFKQVYRLDTQADIDAVDFVRTQFSCNQRALSGPFDVIGDVHGCLVELESMLAQLGYVQAEGAPTYRHPDGRTAIFVGDLISRGPSSLATLAIVRAMVAHGSALSVKGNHETDLLSAMQGQEINLHNGLQPTLDQVAQLPAEEQEQILAFIDQLPFHLLLDEGKLAVAHGGIKANMQGRESADIESFNLYAESGGPSNHWGMEIKPTWALEYEGNATVVHGHLPVKTATWTKQVLNLDTGCVYGGHLSAFRYPEREIVTVKADQEYATFVDTSPPEDGLANPEIRPHQSVDFARITGRNLVSTSAQYYISIKDDIAPTVLDHLVQNGTHPGQLVYLPPLLSPTKSSSIPGYLEHPREAFNYYAKKGLSEVIVEEMQGGAKTTILLAKDQQTAYKKLCISDKSLGIAINSLGSYSFQNEAIGNTFIERFHSLVTELGIWETLSTDWICVEGELLPSSNHWQGMEDHFQRMQAGGSAVFPAGIAALEEAQTQGVDVSDLLNRTLKRQEKNKQFNRQLETEGKAPERLEDYRFVPSFLLASEGDLHFEKQLSWHFEWWKNCQERDALFQPSVWQLVSLNAEVEKQAIVSRFETLSDEGKPGMLMRPPQLIIDAGSDLIQPGLKIRGKEYLRLVYGPDYDLPELLEVHRKRRLKEIRQLTVRQLALGYEGLKSFVNHKDVNASYECIFALLCLQCTDVDPRQSF